MNSRETNDDQNEFTLARFCIGIDLGTTNCVLAYVDTERLGAESVNDGSNGASEFQVETFLVPQWVDLDVAEARATLPSFHYTLHSTENLSRSEKHPWLHNDNEDLATCVGEYARIAGLLHPARQIASAKSWLSHEGVDRTADLLPWHGDPDVARRSPADASASYLRHLAEAWDAEHPDHPMSEQDIVITLPASFDEVARELTVRAAKMAGLPRIQLIEEPQAAFYAWLDRHRDDWRDLVQVGQLILVCDIGGGTTDLTLIRVRPADSEHEKDVVQFHRVAVGKHLILGGDNLDLAVAKAAEAKLNQTLTPRQWQQLLAASRQTKETFLSDSRPERTTIHLPGEGSSLIGGGIQVEMTAEEVDELLLEGFFPQVDLDASVTAEQSGFQEVGLPYAADPAVTRHLAEFLREHRRTGLDQNQEETSNLQESDAVNLVLFNGGVLTAPAIRQRLVGSLSRWFGEPAVLDASRLDLAVAQGAAHYAMVRRGHGVRIAANLARAYFIQIEQNPPRAVCVIPADAQPGTSYQIDQLPMELSVGVPVSFPLWVSSTRLADRPGDVVDIDPQTMTPLPPIQTALRDRKRRDQSTMEIVIQSELSEIGTVGLFCVSGPKRWRLEFDIRGTLETDRESHEYEGESAGIVDEETLDECRQLIQRVFVEKSLKPSLLVKRLQTTVGSSRDQWPPSFLRQLWEALMDVQDQRRQSPSHESRWLNLAGFALRPGYGVAVDDWRTSQTWRMIHGKIAHADQQVRAESYVLWRRIAGGMTSGQQVQLATTLGKWLLAGPSNQDMAEANEAWRTIGAMERLPIDTKRAFASAILEALDRKKMAPLHPSLLWTLGRLASRVLAYGPMNLIVPAGDIGHWMAQLTHSKSIETQDSAVRRLAAFTITQMTRRCDDRFRDVDQPTRDRALTLLKRLDAPDHWKELVRSGGKLDHEEQQAVFGDTLPLGISLRG
ncbi:hsp70 family protein [Rhodopirellula sp. JC740]|uniref:Hsp70 family protein n=1 Tax=Rhodopirellula halodulae TaxID=2894198 RepID=A0ABS8NIV3_9BACT|nr:hsp70 family protein [Rhodopirellula sp. JC740]MCC9643486.1 hsp70 family protein [Rhodopirellula sp. JC740]